MKVHDGFSRETVSSNVVAFVRLVRSDHGRATNQTATVGCESRTLEREFDPFGRLTINDGSTYGYAADGRIALISNEIASVEYQYTTDRLDAGYTLTLANSIVFTRATTRDPYRRALVTAITNSAGDAAVETFAYAYDELNERVTTVDDRDFDGVVDETGTLVASYTYDAFGKTIAQSGAMPNAFCHRFSTKYYDPEIGLYYYGMRFYDPVLHRWLNRDPIEEDGGFNLYAFCGNNGVSGGDFLGMAKFYVYFVGDSLTHGLQDKGKNGQGIYDGYKHMLEHDLNKKYSRYHDFEFDGVGAPGLNIAQIADALKNSDNRIPDKCNGIIILFLAGMNNMATGGTTEEIEQETEVRFNSWKSLRDNTVKAIGSSTYQRLFIAMTLPSLTTSKDNVDKKYWRRNYAISFFNSRILSSTFDSPNLTYKTVQLGVKKPGRYVGNVGNVVNYDLYEVGNHIEDGLHYTDKGNRLIVNTLLNGIKPWAMDNTRFARKRDK